MAPADLGNLSQAVSALCALVSVLVVIWNVMASKDALRKASASALEAKAAALEMANAARWHDTEVGKAVIMRVDSSVSRLGIVEEKLLHVATREDAAHLSGKIDALARTTTAAVAGIDRLEGFFLQEGLQRR
jgi:hypothetical protein